MDTPSPRLARPRRGKTGVMASTAPSFWSPFRHPVRRQGRCWGYCGPSINRSWNLRELPFTHRVIQQRMARASPVPVRRDPILRGPPQLRRFLAKIRAGAYRGRLTDERHRKAK